MTCPDPKANQDQAGEGGGILPALLAGAGLLLVGALFFFGGDDEEDATQADAAAQRSASAQTADKGQNAGVAARSTDAARPRTEKPKPKLNPRLAGSVVDNGMAPSKPGNQGDPTSFESKDDEITYWEDQLVEANRMLEIRQRAVESIPGIEEKIRNGNDPENGLKEFEKRKEVVKDNLDKAKSRVEEVEGKLASLRG